MNPQLSLIDPNKPVVYLFSDPEALGVSLVKTTLSFNCSVMVIGDEVEKWQNLLGPLSTNPNLFFSKQNTSFSVSPLGYIIWDDHLLKRSQKDILKLTEISSIVSNKKFYLIPFSFSQQKEREVSTRVQSLLNIDPEAQFIYIGNVIGEHINLLDSDDIALIINNLFTQNTLPSSSGEFNVYPTDPTELSKKVVGSLFSFGLSEKYTAIIPKEIMYGDFIEKLKVLFPKTGVSNLMMEKRENAKVDEVIKLGENFDSIILKTLAWFKKEIQDKEIKKEIVNKKDLIKKNKQVVTSFNIPIPVKKLNKKNRIKTPRPWVYLIVITFIFMPFILLTLSLTSFWGGYKLIGRGNISQSKTLFVIAKGAGYASNKTLAIYSQIPGVNKITKVPESLAELSSKGSKLILKGLDLIEDGKTLLYGIFQDTSFNTTTSTEAIAGGLDDLYTQTGFLAGELEQYPKKTQDIVNKYISPEEVILIRDKIITLKSLLYYLPDMLGQFGPRTYLVLLQNNMELRPTGGFIGSFALIKFDQGRLVDVNVQDVYSADGQLKGYVEPPAPLVKYMNQAAWYLRDANWDPDFTVTAQKIQWFLDKEINQKVDGVIGIDLEVVKSLIEVFGPVSLTDYSQTITSSNFYEKTQHEVENEFFAGSIKKASFLTALSRQLLISVTDNLGKTHASLAKIMYFNLDQKHIQIYLNNKAAQDVISKLKYDGGVQKEKCSGNCFADWVGYVDSNLGVNKANYYIQRAVNLTTYLESQKIQRYLTIDIKNNANPNLGDKVIYKSYLRVLVPLDSLLFGAKVGSVEVQSDVLIEENKTLSYKEGGVWVEVRPGETKRIIFSWQGSSSIDFSKTGYYQVTVRKQAGTLADPFSWAIYMPNNVTALGDNKFSLTKEGFYLYNTSLVRDISPQIFWK